MNRFMKFLPAFIILCITISYTVCSFFMPPLGDDLGFILSFTNQNDCFYAAPRSMYRHWLWNNGRFADMLLPVGLVVMPLWLRALTNGLMTGAMFWIVTRICVGKNGEHPIRAIFSLALLAFTLRWDSIWMEFATQYNYVWATTLSLLSLLAIRHSGDIREWLKWLLVPICFLGAAMHEACGLPLACGLIGYLIVNKRYKDNSIAGKLMIFAFLLGAIFPLTSPGAYTRLGYMSHRDSPTVIIFGSAFYLVILILASVILAICKPHKLRELARGRWLIFTIASVISSAFTIVSGCGGRTGWFVQIFALIALFEMVRDVKVILPGWLKYSVALILSFCILFHFDALARWQIKLGREAREVTEMYKGSPEGIVYYDFTPDSALPWYLLRKVHGVPDADDTYYRYKFSKFYGKENFLTILPKRLKEMDMSDLHGVIRIDNDYISAAPLPGSYEDKIVNIFPRTMVRIEGREFIQIQFSKDGKLLYFYTLVDRDQGEK